MYVLHHAHSGHDSRSSDNGDAALVVCQAYHSIGEMNAPYRPHVHIHTFETDQIRNKDIVSQGVIIRHPIR